MGSTLSDAFDVTVTDELAFPLYSVYSAIITDRGGTPVPESNARYWDKPTYPTSGTVYASISALNSAIASASPGDVLRLQDGSYSNATITCASSGNSSNPITIAAQTKGGVNLTGSSSVNLNGDFTNYFGFDMRDTLTARNDPIIVKGDDNVVAFCTIDNLYVSDPAFDMPYIRIGDDNGNTTRNRVCYNTLANKTNDQQMVKAATSNDLVDPSTYLRIDHNKFDNMHSRAGTNAGECIHIGQDNGDTDSWALIDNNHLYRYNYNGVSNIHDDFEAMTLKARAIIVTQNVMEECYGHVNCRESRRVDLSWNYFQCKEINGMRGFVLCGEGNRAIGNYIDGANNSYSAEHSPIGLSSGGSGTNEACTNSEIAFNTVVNSKRVIIFNNNGGTTPSTSNAFYNNAIELKSGDAVLDEQTSSTRTWFGNVIESPLGITTPSGVTVATPALTVDNGYEVPTSSGNLDGTGASGASAIARMTDILGNSVPTSSPNVGAFQSGWSLTTNPAQVIIDEAGA